MIYPKDDEWIDPLAARREELARLVERHAPKDGVYNTAIDGLVLGVSHRAQPATHTVYQPSICIIARGSKLVFLGKDTYRYDTGHYLLASVDLPTFGHIEEPAPGKPHIGLNLRLDAGQLATLAMEMGMPPEPPKTIKSDIRGMTVGTVDVSLIDAVLRLVRLLESPQDVKVLAPMAQREVMYRLLMGEHGAKLRQFTADNSKTIRITRAINWIKEHYAEPFRIEDVARAAYMSPSGLHHYFKQVTSMSPLQYQKQLRLQEARRLMLGEAVDAATASYRVGYESPSQFSREYSRLFGAPPLRDIKALRQAEA